MLTLTIALMLLAHAPFAEIDQSDVACRAVTVGSTTVVELRMDDDLLPYEDEAAALFELESLLVYEPDTQRIIGTRTQGCRYWEDR